MQLKCFYLAETKDDFYEYIKKHFLIESSFFKLDQNTFKNPALFNDENVIVYIRLKSISSSLLKDLNSLNNCFSNFIIESSDLKINQTVLKDFLCFKINEYSTYFVKGFYPLFFNNEKTQKKDPFFYCSYFISLWIDKKKQDLKSLIQFKDYENMIYKISCEFALKYNKDKEELLSDAWLGFDEALKKFDPFKGISFSTYAYIKIAGSIADAMRKEKNRFYKKQILFSDYYQNEEAMNQLFDEQILHRYRSDLQNPYLDFEDYFEMYLSELEKKIYFEKFILNKKKPLILKELKISSYTYQKAIYLIKEKIKDFIQD